MIKIANELVSHLALPKAKQADPARQTSLTTWYLKPIYIRQTRMAIFINEATLAPVLLPAIDILAVPATQLLESVLAPNLYSQGVEEDKIDQYFLDCFAVQEAVPHTTSNFTLERTYQEYQQILKDEKLDLMQEQESQKLLQHLLVLMNKLVDNVSSFVNDPFADLASAVKEHIKVVDSDIEASSEKKTRLHDKVSQQADASQRQALNQLMKSDTVQLLFQELFDPQYSQVLDRFLGGLTPAQRQELRQRLQKLDKK